MEDCLESVMQNCLIEDLLLPLTVVAADLKSGQRVDLDEGQLFSAIIGSTALPGIFPPVPREGDLLSDYGVLCSIPMESAAKHDPDLVIAVDLSPPLDVKEEFESGLDVINRMDSISCQLLNGRAAAQADLVIRPQIDGVSWADFMDMDKIVEQGRNSALAILPELHSLRMGIRK